MRAILTSLALMLAAPAAAGWDVVEGVGYAESGSGEDWRVDKTFPAGFEAPVEGFRIEGYAVVFEAQADLREVLLVPDASQCPFCGGEAGYGPTLAVIFADPVAIPDPAERIVVEGALVPVADPGTYEAFLLEDARLIAP